MSCKFCRGGEPLLDKHPDMTLTIDGPCAYKKASLMLRYNDYVEHRYIDYCPVCGEELRPFGPSWTHERD